MNERPQQERWSVEQLRLSLARTLTNWDGHTPLWLFGYASLIWKPEFAFAAREPAHLYGYHRRLCLRSVRYRGTPDCPGIVAGLDRGGSCFGIGYQIAAAHVLIECEKLWEREMFLGSYEPTWVRLRLLASGARVAALTFVVRRDSHNFCERLAESELVDILCHASGVYGTSLDYLQRTVAALREAGLRDPHLEQLAQVAARQLARNG